MSQPVTFHKPTRGDLWFRRVLLSDPPTMSYNVYRLYEKGKTGDRIYLTYGSEMKSYLSNG